MRTAALFTLLAGGMALMNTPVAAQAPLARNALTGESLDARLDPEVRTVLAEAAKGSGLPAEIGAKRRAFNQVFAGLSGTPQAIREVRDLRVPGPGGEIPIRVYRPAEGTLPVLVYTHGGGFEKGDLESHDPALRILAHRCGCLVVAVDYRRTPEHRFPAQTDDAFAVLRWVHANAAQIGADPARIGVGGDSVGGNLAAVSAIRAVEEGGPRLSYQILFYPVTDVTLGSRSWQEFATGPWLSREYEMNAVNRVYTDGRVDPRDPRVSPLYAPEATLRRLPPALVIDAEFDGYRDEGQEFARKLRAAGVAAEGRVYPGMIHDFVFMPGALKASRDALEEAGAHLRRAWGTTAVDAR